MAPSPAPHSPLGQIPLLWQGRCPDVWSLKCGLSQKLCCFCLSQKLCCFCSVHSHLHRLVSEGPETQDGSPRCSSKSLPGGVDTSPLAGKVPGCLEPEKVSASEALWLLPVPEAVSFCSPHSHRLRLVLESGNQDVSHRCSGNRMIILMCS